MTAKHSPVSDDYAVKMEIRHLKLVKSIVEQGSLAKAIGKLHLTQSALSHQLKEAEFQLGTRIFHRINKKLVLTNAGKKLYATAVKVLQQLSETELEIKKMVFGEAGQIRISGECYSSYHWLPSLMQQFHLIYPKVDLNLVMEATHYPLQKLLSGHLDVGIITDAIDDDNIEYLELFQDEMVAVVATGHAWCSKKFVTPKDFETQNLIIHSLPLNTVTVHEAFLKPAGITPRKVTVLPMTEASIEMVKAEMGVMVMAKWLLKPYLAMYHDRIQTIKIGKNGLKRMHYIATLRHREKREYFNHFIAFLQQEIMRNEE
jgi:LysR family transcriptional regulator for metE and metH